MFRPRWSIWLVIGVLGCFSVETRAFLPNRLGPRPALSHRHSTKLGAASVEVISDDAVLYPSKEYLESRKHHLQDINEYRALYERSIRDPAGFWGEIARDSFHWEVPPPTGPGKEVLNANFDSRAGPVFVEWFRGGRTSIAYNCLDRHVAAGLGDRVAFYTERNEVDPGPLRHPNSYTYKQALDEVSRLANVLKGMGVKKGNKVGIFMPMMAETALAMLACARIGAVHSVVFSGFSKDSLAKRLADAGCKFLITCDGVRRGKKTVPLFSVVEDALSICQAQGVGVDGMVVMERLGAQQAGAQLKPGRDVWWHEATAQASPDCPCEFVDSEDPLFILYTSGSTGKPKGVLHTTAGYMVGAATTYKHVFNVRPEQGDVWFSTADAGWITGHTYTVYGPMLLGATQVVFEGVPSYPDFGRLWQIVDKYKVTHLYTAPTLIRSLMREGDEHVKRHSRKTLKLLASVGEPINPEAWKWYYSVVGDGRCPVADTWWQTETGSIALAPLPVRGWGQKPGSVTLPFFGIQPVLLDTSGHELEGEAEGLLAIKEPWPSCIRGVHGDPDRYVSTYFSFPGYYLSGDNARRDADGYYWITGRSDDIVVVSGHNLGTAEVEATLASHPSVSESAVVGVPHDVKGSALYCYVTLKAGCQPSDQIAAELKALVREQLGAFVVPDYLQWASSLPKTMSGKIIRRMLRKIAKHGKDVKMEDLGDTSTMSDPTVIPDLVANHAFNPGKL